MDLSFRRAEPHDTAAAQAAYRAIIDHLAETVDYPHWHTPGDTLDKVSAESLAITGRVALLMVEKYLLPAKR